MSTAPMDFSPETAAQVAKEYEGKLFVCIFTNQFNNNISVHKEYYTVKNGIVLLLGEEKLYATGDTMLSLAAHCHKIGKYNPERKYKKKVKFYTISEFSKLHKI